MLLAAAKGASAAAATVVLALATWIYGLAALILLVGVLVLFVGLAVVNQLRELIANGKELTVTLGQVKAEFVSDSGTSMRDLADRLDVAAIDNRTAVEVLNAIVAVSTELEVHDRARMTRMDDTLHRMNTTLGTLGPLLAAGVEVSHRIEAQAEGVAADLAAAHARADAVDGDPGASADAAAQSPPDVHPDT